MSDIYILQGKDVVPCPSVERWSEWMDGADLVVARDQFQDGGESVVVETIFMGFNSNNKVGGRLILFETLAEGVEYEQAHWRYSTWDEAEAGHKAWCEARGFKSKLSNQNKTFR